ncbi:MAG: hypothetical protein A2289_24975 [Deltaproteobacteria bacterium RIFOXYA12_FULL_58_15]|nr:MAG: hypothetical protein A2289_24975 [Deltaproteobacteria bacterium RIFOXYA12_FULL_58_15]
MEIHGKLPQLPVQNQSDADRVEERTDEVQGQRQAALSETMPMGPVSITEEKLRELSHADRSPDIAHIIDTTAVDSTVDFRAGVQEKLIALAAVDFSPAHQKDFIKYLERKLDLPDDIGKLAWVKAKLHHLVGHDDSPIATLDAFFRKKGLRPRRWEALPANHPGYQLDRADFRDRVRMAARSGVLDRRTALGLLDRVQNVVDVDDLFWARLQLNRLVDHDKLVFADSRTEKLVNGFFDSRLEGRVGMVEFSWAIRRLRQRGFSAEELRRVASLISRCEKDPDALFHAKRQLQREVGKALQDPSLSHADRDRLEQNIKKVDEALTPVFRKRLDGYIDRYAHEQALDGLRKSGKIDDRRLLAMRAAVTTSRTEEELAYGFMVADVQLQLALLQGQILNAWTEMMREIDEEQRRQNEEERRNEVVFFELLHKEREQKRIENRPLKLRELSQRAWLRGNRQRILTALIGEKDPTRRQSLESQLAGNENEDLDAAAPVNSEV